VNPTTDAKRFAEIVTALSELYGQTITQPAVKLYWQAMQDWPLEDFERAAAHLAKTSRFFPRPADFHALRKQATTLTAGEAWAKVIDHCRLGTYRDGSGIDNGGPIDTATRTVGGYRAIAMHDTSKIHFLQHTFSENYCAGTEATEAAAALTRQDNLLIGA